MSTRVPSAVALVSTYAAPAESLYRLAANGGTSLGHQEQLAGVKPLGGDRVARIVRDPIAGGGERSGDRRTAPVRGQESVLKTSTAEATGGASPTAIVTPNSACGQPVGRHRVSLLDGPLLAGLLTFGFGDAAIGGTQVCSE